VLILAVHDIGHRHTLRVIQHPGGRSGLLLDVQRIGPGLPLLE
jgi:hypothetical protein